MIQKSGGAQIVEAHEVAHMMMMMMMMMIMMMTMKLIKMMETIMLILTTALNGAQRAPRVEGLRW